MMNRRCTLLFITAVTGLTLLADFASASHPFHVSRAEIGYNDKRQTFEVALCVWPEDLEKAISRMEKRTFNIDTETEKGRDELFKKYVAKNFRFTSKAKNQSENVEASELRWVGSEIKIKQGWLYFEVDARSDSGNWTIENDMFFELNEDQMNHVQISRGRILDARTLSPKTPSTEWSVRPQ